MASFFRRRGVQGQRARAQEQATRLRDQESASREALGLDPISVELSALYDQLGRAGSLDDTTGPVRSINDFQLTEPRRRPGQAPAGPSLIDQISTLNASARENANLSPGDAPDPGRVRPGRFENLAGRGQQQLNDAVSEVPGLQTALNTLRDRQNTPLERNVAVEGDDRTAFQSGAGAANSGIQDALDLVNRLRTGTNLGDATTESRVGAAGQLGNVLRGAERSQGRNQDSANFRSTLVSNSNAAQRDVRAINQSIFGGRRRRRGSSVQLPQVALAGLGEARSRLLSA